MANTSRSKRVSYFETVHKNTPTAVGPGSYFSPESSHDDAHGLGVQVKPGFSGFGFSQDRNLNANKTTSATTPGPGAYSNDNQIAHGVHMSNVFATKISRLAPSAPGSTIYLPSSIETNPGPGSYDYVESKRNKRRSNQVQTFITGVRVDPEQPPKESIPTIPRKDQSYGYVMSGSEFRRQAPPFKSYSGIGDDTVGPAAYSSHKSIWNEKKNAAASLVSTSKRELWEMNTPRLKVPGPGQYDSGNVVSRKQRASAVFSSKVPILNGYQKATAPDEEKAMEQQEKEERWRRRRQQKESQTAKHVASSFGSKAGRSELCTRVDAPYSKPTYLTAPGPGNYSKAGKRSVLRVNNHRERWQMEEGVGFTSASERYCLSKAEQSALPGPGAYGDVTPRSLGSNISSKRAIGRYGVFGTTSERNVWDQLQRQHAIGEGSGPGPGAYGSCALQASSIRDLDPAQAAMYRTATFKSSSSRFIKPPNSHASPYVQYIGNDSTPGVGHYSLEVSGQKSVMEDSLLTPTPMMWDSTISDVEYEVPKITRRPGFLSTSKRRVFDASEARELPGPGAYSEREDRHEWAETRSLGRRRTIGNELRFRVNNAVPPEVGPGTYPVASTMASKSFNVTMKRKETSSAGAELCRGRVTIL